METHVEYFINWIMLGTSGIIALVFIFDRFFDRRHSLVLLVLYCGTKAILVAYYETLFNYLASDHWDVLIWTVYTLFTTIANFVIIYYTWQGEALKIAIIGVMSDVFTASTMLASMALVNIVSGRETAFSYLGMSIGEGAAISCLSVLLIPLLLWIIRPAIRWFRDHEPRHRKLTLLFVIAIIAFFTASKVSVSEKTDISLVIGYSLIFTLAIPLVIYMFRRTRQSLSRRTVLRQRQEIASGYALAVKKQTDALEEGQRFLEHVKSEIDRIRTTSEKGYFDSYLSKLNDQAESLRYGRYSSDVFLDAILLAYDKRLREKDIDVSIRITPIGGHEDLATEICMLLLEWLSKQIRNTGSEAKQSVKLNISKEAGQLVYIIEMTSIPGPRFSKKILSSILKKEDVVIESREDDKRSITIIQGVEE